MSQNRHLLDQQLDRLADGELSRREYQQLLEQLDEVPGGWRRCALALLEARALHDELSTLRGEIVAPVITPSPVPARLPTAASRWKPWLALAAGFLVALPLGGYWFAPPSISKVSATVEPPVADGAPHRRPETPRPLGKVQLVTDEGQLDVPYYDAESGAAYLLDDRGALPEATIRSLERAGHLVERRPAIMPIDLDNGSRVYFPIDNYRITPVSDRPIQ